MSEPRYGEPGHKTSYQKLSEENARLLSTLESCRAELAKREEIAHNWSEDGGGLIVPTGYGFVLYEVPQYGGEPMFSKHCKTLDEAKKIADGWT